MECITCSQEFVSTSDETECDTCWVKRGPPAKPPHGLDKVLALAGSQRALARQLGVSQAAICKWVRRGCVPPGRCVEIEAQYGVSRRELLEPRFMDLLDAPLGEGEG